MDYKIQSILDKLGISIINKMGYNTRRSTNAQRVVCTGSVHIYMLLHPHSHKKQQPVSNLQQTSDKFNKFNFLKVILHSK